MSWQPSASLPVLQQRAALYQTLRQFFLDRDVLEVDVPVLSEYATVDPFIDSLQTQVLHQPHYLQTSPEFFLKRLLSAYQQDVYYLGKAFRQGEKGHRHSPEFTMLEWYRVGLDERQLMQEVRQLITSVIPDLSWQEVSYAELFQQHLGLDPHTASVDELRRLAKASFEIEYDSDDKNPWLDVLFTHCIEPQLPKGMVGIYDYPETQAALARIDHNAQGQSVAKRFEVYLHGVELANGYWELNDATEQLRRFKADQQYRRDQGLPVLPYDQHLVDALSEGAMPNCAGVALGVDRLLMQKLGENSIHSVISFSGS